MLKQRLLTAGILIPLFLWLVLAAPTSMVALALAGVLLLGAREWAALYHWTEQQRLRFMLALAALALIAYLGRGAAPFIVLYTFVATLLWAGIAAWLWRHRMETVPETDVFLQRLRGSGFVVGLIVLTPCFAALVWLHHVPNDGPRVMMFCLSLLWVADSAAYFAGRRFGKRKLAPAVSPGKTWEGLVGAWLAVTLWTWLGAKLFSVPLRGFGFLLLCWFTLAYSVVGDLWESQIKRLFHAKDSGTLLPGHGGVLDRIDSATAGAPIFALGYWWLS